MKYTCENHKPVTADSHQDAAAIFAERKARAENGKQGRVGALNCNSWSSDNTLWEYDAFIGSPGRRIDNEQNSIVGRNIRFTVYLEEV